MRGASGGGPLKRAKIGYSAEEAPNANIASAASQLIETFSVGKKLCRQGRAFQPEPLARPITARQEQVDRVHASLYRGTPRFVNPIIARLPARPDLRDNT